MNEHEPGSDWIAIIGMAGRFPGANNVNQFWENLRNGVESIQEFSDETLLAAGVPESTLDDPHYVKAGTVLKDIDRFDNAFFGLSSKEAAVIDPQQRLFLQSCWHAIEDAGYCCSKIDWPVGVFGGVSVNSYSAGVDFDSGDDVASEYAKMIGNDKDFVASRVAYCLNLRGPAITVQTACSTSLVAVHLACQHLLTYQCDMALAGGASILLPQGVGYRYQDGMILSPDGHCRAFDANGQGIVVGRGVGVVALKRYEEAVQDRDAIVAVIRGSAANNDGSDKVGFTAPSVVGQSQVIAEAVGAAEIDFESIRYVEAHGTATPLGDPIEIAALTRAFRSETQNNQFCRIGSVKTNIGHLDVAAGVAGLIKAALVLKHRAIPPSLNFTTPNPEIEFANTPFVVNDRFHVLEPGAEPLRSCVSSFGIGGTNAHVVLEEAPLRVAISSETKPKILTLSAKTEASLKQAKLNLRDFFRESNDSTLNDVAQTLQNGREDFAFRTAVAVVDRADAVEQLQGDHNRRAVSNEPGHVTFMFSGQGSQYPGMGRELYQGYPAFRQKFDECNELLSREHGIDLASLIFDDQARDDLNQTRIAQPALFVLEYALAHLWMSWGIKPAGMVGHSLGEYVAACLASVFSLKDALALVVRRGELMQSMPPGSMLAVFLSEEEATPYLNENVSIATLNGPGRTVLSGDEDSIASVCKELEGNGIEYRILRTSHAFHSRMMVPVLKPFEAFVSTIHLQTPKIPFVSNVSGDWITAEEAVSPGYWAKHIRSTVRFNDCLNTVSELKNPVLIEVGPGDTLAAFARQNELIRNKHAVISSIRKAKDTVDDVLFIKQSVAKFWENGGKVDWPAVNQNVAYNKVSLPAYAFERKRHWIEKQPKKTEGYDKTKWFYCPFWAPEQSSSNQAKLSESISSEDAWLVFEDEIGIAATLRERVAEHNGNLVTVVAGDQFANVGESTYSIDPACYDHYAQLMESLREKQIRISRVVHCWNYGRPAWSDERSDEEHLQFELDRGYYSLVHLAKALARVAPDSSPIKINVIASGVFSFDGESLIPIRSTVLGPSIVIPQEFGNLSCSVVDVDHHFHQRGLAPELDELLKEVSDNRNGRRLIFRNGRKWKQDYKQSDVALGQESSGQESSGQESSGQEKSGQEQSGQGNLQDGTYVITGGLGNIGLSVAKYIATQCQANLVLLSRTGLPDELIEANSPLDAVSRRRIDAVEELRTHAQSVTVLRADVACHDQMQVAFQQVREQFGEIRGVVHAAGNIREIDFQSIAETTQAVADSHFDSKIVGLMNVAKAVETHDVQFCAVFSSISAILGGLGYCAYAAANCFQDAFAEYKSGQSKTQWIVGNWDRWIAPDQETTSSGSTALAIGNRQGVKAFASLLSLAPPGRMVITPANLLDSVSKWVDLDKTPSSILPSPDVKFENHEQLPDGIRKSLVEIWSELLGIRRLSIDDSFVELGGDSLLALSVSTRCRKRSINITPAQILKHQTIRRLSDVLDVPAAATEAGSVSDVGPANHVAPSNGDIPLAPFMARFLHERANSNPHRWNVASLLKTRMKLDSELVLKAIGDLVQTHDALRLRFLSEGESWKATIVSDVDLEDAFFEIEIAESDERLVDDSMAAHLEKLQRGLNITHGPLFLFALFNLTKRGEQRLAVVMHHFVIEGISLDIFLNELEQAYLSYESGKPYALPLTRGTFGQWSHELSAMANSPTALNRASQWLALPWESLSEIKYDFESDHTRVNNNRSARTFTIRLSEQEVNAQAELGKGKLGLDVILLSALSTAIGRWQKQNTIYIDRLVHGRDLLAESVDVSRSIGCFTTYSPVMLDCDWNASSEHILGSVNRQLTDVPEMGIAADAVKFLSTDRSIAEKLSQLPRAQILFNYRGRMQGEFESELFEEARESSGSNHDPDGLRYYPISVSADLVDRGELEVRFVYSASLHKEETIAGIAKTFADFLNTPKPNTASTVGSSS